MDQKQPESVAGLMDTARVADFLEIEPSRIRTWVARQGEKGGRLANLFPRPVSADAGGEDPGLLNRGFAWRKDDIVAFSELFATYKPAGGRQAPKP